MSEIKFYLQGDTTPLAETFADSNKISLTCKRGATSSPLTLVAKSATADACYLCSIKGGGTNADMLLFSVDNVNWEKSIILSSVTQDGKVFYVKSKSSLSEAGGIDEQTTLTVSYYKPT